MADPLGASHYSVMVRAVSTLERQHFLDRIRAMEKQAHALQSAVSRMKHAMQTHAHGSQRALASALMDSRTQMLALVISHITIQVGLHSIYADAGSETSQPKYVDELFTKAIDEGMKQGVPLRGE